MKNNNQYDIKECGLVVLQKLYINFYKKEININYLKSLALIGKDGINIAGLQEIAKNINLKLETYECSFENLKCLNFYNPLISIINEEGLNHYIIIFKINKNIVFFYDPLFGTRKLDIEKFSTIFSGIIIKSEKEYYQELNKIKNKFHFLTFDVLSPWIILFSLISLILTFLQSFYIKIIFDNVFESKNKNLLFILLLFFLWIILTKLIFSFLKDYLIKKLEQKNSYRLYLNFQNKLVNINSRILQKNENIDYLRRIGLIESYSNFKSSFSFFVLSEILNLLITSILLFWIDKTLFIYAIIIGLSSLVISYLFNIKIYKYYPKILKANLDFNKSNIDLTFSLKQNNNYYFSKYMENNYKTNLSNYYFENYKFFKVSFLKNIILLIIENVVPLILIYFISLQVLDNQISTGNLLMFISVYSFFISPFYAFSNILNNLPIQRQNLELLNYVFKENIKNKNNKDLVIIEKLSSIELKNINLFFEEGKHIFKDFSFDFNQDYQIKGKNGSGKSSLLEILKLNNIENSGEIFFNNIISNLLNTNKISNKIAYINPHDYLPNIKIIDYLVLQNKEYFDNLQLNINNNDLLEIIQELNLNLNSIPVNNGQNLSSGQRSMIFILKLFVYQYDFILLDEAFENLNQTIFLKLKNLILNYQKNAIFIEVSHNNNFLKNNKELNL